MQQISLNFNWLFNHLITRKFIITFCTILLLGYLNYGFANPKIFDCFLFYNELEILEIRLNELHEHVDRFVIVESTETFKGDSKKLFYAENKDRFLKFSDKIIHVVVSEHFETGVPKDAVEWELNNFEREFFQRNQIMRGLTECSDDDIIFISDVDEIFRKELVNCIFIDLSANKHKVMGLGLNCYRYFLDRFDPSFWVASGATTYKNLKKGTPSQFRQFIQGQDRSTDPRPFHDKDFIDNAGWHFSWMGGYSRVKDKVDAFSHLEWTHPHFSSDPQIIDQNILKDTKQVEIDQTYPEFVQENIEYFKKIGFIYSVGAAS